MIRIRFRYCCMGFRRCDHEAILIDSMAKLNSTPITNIADDDGSLLEEGLKTLSVRVG